MLLFHRTRLEQLLRHSITFQYSSTSQEAGVPAALLAVTTNFGPYHPGVRAAWLQWGLDSLKSPTPLTGPESSPPTLDDISDAALVDDLQGSPAASRGGGLGSSSSGFRDRESMGTTLLQLRREKGVPLSSSDPSTRESMQGATYDK
jgi:hypothetical protein